MRACFNIFFGLMMWVFTSFSFADAGLTAVLNQDIAAQAKNSHIGFIVLDPATGSTLYQYQSSQYFAPASNTKLFTAIAALIGLGPNYHYQTSLNVKNGTVINKAINGNLYIKFSGDPSFSSQDLAQLFMGLKQQGISQINGNLIIDNTVFEPGVGLGVTIDDGMWGFGVPASSIIIDENAMNVMLASNTSKPLVQSVSPPLFNVKSEMEWLSPANQRLCTFQVASKPDNSLILKGCFPKGLSNLNLAIPNPEGYAIDLIQQDVNTAGIALNGKILFGVSPSSAGIVLVSHQSQPLTVLITTMLKNSDDLYAEALTKTLGVKRYGIGSDKAGVAAIEDYLSGYNLPNYTLENGSGSSRYNLVSPMVMAQLMYQATQNKWLNAALMQALPISGVDGTMQSFPSNVLKGKIYAKTGTMEHAANLTGYLITQSGKKLIFSLLIDDSPLTDSQLRLFQAKLLGDMFLEK